MPSTIVNDPIAERAHELFNAVYGLTLVDAFRCAAEELAQLRADIADEAVMDDPFPFGRPDLAQLNHDAEILMRRFGWDRDEALNRAAQFEQATRPDASGPYDELPDDAPGGDDDETGPYSDDIRAVDLAVLSAVVDCWSIVRRFDAAPADPQLAQVVWFILAERRAA